MPAVTDGHAVMDQRARTAALAGVIGPAAFWVAIVIGAWLQAERLDDLAARPGLRAGYSHVYSFVSELAAVDSGGRVVMWLGFVTFGVCSLVVAGALRRLWPTATALCIAVAVSGAGLLGAGTFSCDPGCPTEGDVRVAQELHDVFSVVTFPAWMACAAIAAWQLRDRLFGRVSLVLAVVQVGTGLVLGTWRDRAADDPVGVVQRINLAAVAVWFVLLAVELRRTPAGGPEPAS
jgi:hypothetical protein